MHQMDWCNLGLAKTTKFLEQFLEQSWQGGGLLNSRDESVDLRDRPQRAHGEKNWRYESLRPLTNAIAIDAPTARTKTASIAKNQVAATYSNQRLPPIQPLPMST